MLFFVDSLLNEMCSKGIGVHFVSAVSSLEDVYRIAIRSYKTFKFERELQHASNKEGGGLLGDDIFKHTRYVDNLHVFRNLLTITIKQFEHISRHVADVGDTTVSV